MRDSPWARCESHGYRGGNQMADTRFCELSPKVPLLEFADHRLWYGLEKGSPHLTTPIMSGSFGILGGSALYMGMMRPLAGRESGQCCLLM